MNKKIPVNSKSRRPSFQFYPADWRGDLNLRICSISTKGLWIELMCLLHDSEKYGYLLINGKKPSDNMVARLLMLDENNYKKLLKELHENGVIKIDNEGVYYSKRMVKDFKLSELRRKVGSKGGNPNLVNYRDNQIVVKAKADEDEKANVKEKEIVKDIIEDLNGVLKTNYRATSKKNIDLIKARMNEGFALEDFKKVHRNMAMRWGADNKMREFLRPITLYSNKFESYLNIKQDLPFNTHTAKNIQIGQEWLKEQEEKDNEKK